MFVICPKCGAKYQIPAHITLKSGQKMQCSACEHYFVFTPEMELKPQKTSFHQNESVEKNNFWENQPVVTAASETVLPPKYLEMPEVFHPLVVCEKKTSLLLPVLVVVFSFLILLILLGIAWQYRLELRDQNILQNLRSARSESVQVSHEKQEFVGEEKVPVAVDESARIKETEPFVEESEREVSLDEIEASNLSSTTQEVPLSFHSVRFQLIQNQERSDVQIEGFVHNDSNEEVFLPQVLWATAYDLNGNALFKKEIYLPQTKLYSHQEVPFFGTYSPAPKEIKWIDISYQK